MSPGPDDKSAVVKLALKRANLIEIVQKDSLLRGTPFVQALGSDADDVLRMGTARRYPDKTVLFQNGDPGNSLFFVLKGDVRLSGRKGMDAVELGTAGRGEVFGEIELLSGVPSRTTAAVAQGDVDAVEFKRELWLSLGKLDPQIVKLLTPISKSRLAKLDELTDFMNRW